MAHLIGLMSGTSLDGADAVLAHIDGAQLKVLAHSHTPFEPSLRAELLALNTPGPDELHRAALAANRALVAKRQFSMMARASVGFLSK